MTTLSKLGTSEAGSAPWHTRTHAHTLSRVRWSRSASLSVALLTLLSTDVYLPREGLEVVEEHEPDGRHARRHRHRLARHELKEAAPVHAAAGEDELGARRRCRVRKSPPTRRGGGR